MFKKTMKFDNLEGEESGGIVVDGLHVPEHGLYAKRGGIRWGFRDSGVERSQPPTSADD